MEVSAWIILNWYSYLFIPLLIFFARICDVSLGTIRIIFIGKGFKALAPIIGFFEVLIWLLAIRQIMSNLTNPVIFLAYAAGFAAGTYAGIYIEEKISLGKVMVRIITRKDASKLLKSLKNAHYTFTSMGAESKKGNVRLIMTVINREDSAKVVSIINKFNPNAFYSIEDIKFASGDHLHPKTRKNFLGMLRMHHKK